MDDPTAGELKRALRELGFRIDRTVGNIDILVLTRGGRLVGSTYLPHQDNQRIKPRQFEAIAFEAFDGDDRNKAAMFLRRVVG